MHFRVEEHVLCLDKFFDCEQSDCVGKLGDAQSTLSNRFRARRGRPGPRNSGGSETKGNDEDWLQTEKVFSIVIQRYCRSPTGRMKDLDVTTTFWSAFLRLAFRAAVHLWKDYTENLRSCKYQPLKSLRQFFQVTEILITEQA